MAGLYKYFQWQSLPMSKETSLDEVATKEANTSVERVLKERQKRRQKCKYTHFTPEQRAKIAKYAAESGNSAAVRHFKKEFPTLGESTVRLFKKQYESELKKNSRKREISSLPEEQGSSRVEVHVAGVGDKRQITITVAGTLSGTLLPFQVLYEGKT